MRATTTPMVKFGLSSKELKTVALILGSMLNVDFVLHESHFRGGDYYSAEAEPGMLFLQENYDLLDQEPFESSWPADSIVLYLDGPDDRAWTEFASALLAIPRLTVFRL